MTKLPEIHVTYHALDIPQGRWHVAWEGSSDPLSTHSSKESAVDWARQQAAAAHSGLVVYDETGKISLREGPSNLPA